jgi:putative hydrolase of the HAD superfamily
MSTYDAAMPQISLVLFDMHDVLCRYDRARRIADLTRLSGTPEDEIFAKIWQSGFEDRADSGALDEAAYLQGFGERLGYPISRDEWLDNRRRATTPMPEVLALLAAVRVQTPVAVLTNNHMLVRDHLDVLFPELFALCGGRFYVSAQFGAAKPEPAVYLACVAAAGGIPAATLFIDDSEKNIAGAARAGLATHWFASAGALRDDLMQYGLL